MFGRHLCRRTSQVTLAGRLERVLEDSQVEKTIWHIHIINKSKLLREHLRYTPITNSLQENEDDT